MPLLPPSRILPAISGRLRRPLLRLHVEESRPFTGPTMEGSFQSFHVGCFGSENSWLCGTWRSPEDMPQPSGTSGCQQNSPVWVAFGKSYYAAAAVLHVLEN